MSEALAWALGLSLLAAGCGSSSVHTLQPQGEHLRDLAWLAGSWHARKPDGMQIEEHWTQPMGGTMLGVNRTIVDGETVHFEYLRIERADDGVYYVASPSGQSTARFRLVERGGRRVCFANPEHDFPKRITYVRSGTELTARVEGEDRVERWRWQRARLGTD